MLGESCPLSHSSRVTESIPINSAAWSGDEIPADTLAHMRSSGLTKAGTRRDIKSTRHCITHGNSLLDTNRHTAIAHQKGPVQQRLLQRLQRGELLLVEAGEALAVTARSMLDQRTANVHAFENGNPHPGDVGG